MDFLEKLNKEIKFEDFIEELKDINPISLRDVDEIYKKLMKKYSLKLNPANKIHSLAKQKGFKSPMDYLMKGNFTCDLIKGVYHSQFHMHNPRIILKKYNEDTMNDDEKYIFAIIKRRYFLVHNASSLKNLILQKYELTSIQQ